MTLPDRSIYAKTFVKKDLERLGFKLHNKWKIKECHRTCHRYSTNTDLFVYVANTNINDVSIHWNDEVIFIRSREQWAKFRDEKLLPIG